MYIMYVYHLCTFFRLIINFAPLKYQINLKMSQYNSDDSESHITQNSQTHIDKLIEIDNLNAVELLTPSDVLESIQTYDSTM